MNLTPSKLLLFVSGICLLAQSRSFSSEVILNEFNAVSSSQTVVGGTGDPQFGTVAGNGGDWFELVVVGAGVGTTVDMRGWRLELQRRVIPPFTPEDVLVLSQDAYWAAVPAGTILTFTELRTADGGLDTDLNRTDLRILEGWAHSNIWMGDPTLITYTDRPTNGYDLDPVTGVDGVNVNEVDTQIRIVNSTGGTVFGPAGERVQPITNEIDADEVFALQQTPSGAITPTSHYGDTTDGTDLAAYSSFGRPNRWQVGEELFDQSFTGFKQGGAEPVFLSSPRNTLLFVGDAYSYDLTSHDADADAVTLSIVQGPSFLSLSDAGNGTGQVSGTPLAADVGTYPVRLRVQDTGGSFHEQAVVLTVLPTTSPVIVNEYNAVSNNDRLSEPWSFDQRFGRVKGNGDDWIELVVVGSGTAGTVDMRGWRIDVSDSGAVAGVVKLSNDAFWAAVPTGMILTFTESDTAAGGADTILMAEDRLATEGWAWSNVLLSDSALLDQAIGSDTFSIVGVETRITISDAAGALVAGPYGEGVFSAGSVNSTEVFRLALDPAPSSHPLTPQFGDADTSTFGHPNRLVENDGTVVGMPAGSSTGYQVFKNYATGTANAAPFFTNLWGTPDVNNTLVGSAWPGPAITASDPDHAAANLTFSLDSAPLGMSLSNTGAGTASLSWTPSAGQIGQHGVTVIVADPGGASLTRTFSVTVMPPSSEVLLNEFNAVDSTLYLNDGTFDLDEDLGMASDPFFGRIRGNGANWIELVVVGDGTSDSLVDMRGWKIEISINSCPSEVIALNQNSYWGGVRAGTILTFVNRDTIAGGLDSSIHRVNQFQALGYAWTNIVVGDPTFIDQVSSDFGNSFSVTSDEAELTIRNAAGAIVSGPAGEPRVTRSVTREEVFHLESDPAPSVTPSVADVNFPNYADNDESSSFGAPNRWQSGGIDFEQNFAAFTSVADTNSKPAFTELPTFFYGVGGVVHSQPIQATDADGSASLSLSVGTAPAWASVVDSGNGTGSVDWAPPTSASGFYQISLVASDAMDAVVRTFTIFVHPTPSPVLLNEYNAVPGSGFLNGGTAGLDDMGGTAADTHFGRTAGNGGDWFELVVVGDDGPGQLDMRGWSIEVASNAGFPFARESVIQLSSDPSWAAIPHGTILTFSEEPASGGGMDTSILEIDNYATQGWAWSNIWLGDPVLTTYTNALTNGYVVDSMTGGVSNFDITGSRTQFVIKDKAGNVVLGPAGEGIAPLNGISSATVWEIVGDPRSTLTPHAVADLGMADFGAAASATESSFGHPNLWSDGAAAQDFSVFVSPFSIAMAAAGLIGEDGLILADPDGDGNNNGEEFAFGTNPAMGGSQPEFYLPAGIPSFTMLRRVGGTLAGGKYSVDGLDMEVMFSTALVNWSVAEIIGSNPGSLPAPPAGYEYATFNAPASMASSNRIFARVRVGFR